MQVNFLRENPVLDGMQQAQQIDAGRARADLLDMQVEGARSAQRQERAATEALNRIYARGGNLSSGEVQRQLAADPSIGGTRRLKALQDAEDSDQKRTQIEGQAKERQARAFKLYVDSGMFAAAAEEAKRMGLNIPPQFWADQEKVRALKQRLDVEEKQARIRQSNAAAGASRALAQSRQPDSYEDFTDTEGRVVRRDKATGKSQYVTDPEGNPIRVETKKGVAEVGADARRDVAKTQAEARAQGGGPGGRPLNIEARRQMLIDAGLDPREAALIAGGAAVTPAQRAQIRQRIQAGVVGAKDNVGRPQFRTPQEQQAEVARRESEVFGDAQQARQPQGEPATPGSAADIPRGGDGKVDHRQLVDGQVYLIPLKKGGQTTGRWNAQTGRFDEVN